LKDLKERRYAHTSVKKFVHHSLLLLFLFVVISTFAGDIKDPHPEGFFVELTSIGHSWGNFEVSSAPLLDILGDYNVKLRHFPSENNVVQLSIDVLDPGLLPTYFGQPRETSIFLWNLRGYYHLNAEFGKFSLKPHIEVNNSGIVITESEPPQWLQGTWAKGYVQLGYYPTKSTELFMTLEAGELLDVRTEPVTTDTEFQEFVQTLKENAGYTLLKLGGRWYYDPYSSVELGYRFTLDDGYLIYAQGFTITDWIYNFFAFLKFLQETAEPEEVFPQINIPFITTNYYLTFSARF